MALPKSTPISQLMANVKANIKRLRHEQHDARHLASTSGVALLAPEILLSRSAILDMAEQAHAAEVDYTTRTLDQEIDAVEICRAHNEFMIIGTYSLVKKDSKTEYAGQVRRGSIRVMAVSPTFKPSYPGMLPPQLDSVDLPCAVLDIHFHPEDPTLLGVATSNGRMYFYRFIAHGDVLGRRVVTKLLSVGIVRVADNDEHGLTPLVTQFTWFDELLIKGTRDYDDVIVVALAATTSFGETRVMKLSVPAIRTMHDWRLEQDETLIFSSSEIIHKHDLEAWTVATINFSSGANIEKNNGGGQRLVLSGGDDSALLASVTTPAIPEWPASGSDGNSIHAMHLWHDRRNHNAGVVSILPLMPPPLTRDTDPKQPRSIPVLTGSYDEFLRIFEVDSKIFRPAFKTELRLSGGVWRLKVLDEYTKATSNDKGTNEHEYHYLLLASLMHGGAAIIRITYIQTSASASPSSSSPTDSGTWAITPLTSFTSGHESMVYACAARLENPGRTHQDLPHESSSLLVGKSGENEKGRIESMFEPREKKAEAPRYTIVSTSFYDMRICDWTFVDEFKVQH